MYEQPERRPVRPARPDRPTRRADPDADRAGLFSADADHLRAIEAMILVAQEPVAPELLAQLLERSVTDVERWCHELAAGYEADGKGFQLVHVAGGYRLQTHPDLTPYVERFLLHDQRARLSGAALETLAIVAYKQPISRAQVASIRGVDPDGVLRTLQGRGYIDVVGHDSGPGQATLYGTTVTFLEKLGLDRIEDLPPIAEFIPGADVVEALEVGLRVSGTGRAPMPTSLTATTGPRAAAVGAARRRRGGPAGHGRAERRAAAEGPGEPRLRQPAGVRGPHRRRPRDRERRDRRARQPRRPRRRSRRGRRGAGRHEGGPRALPAEQAGRRGDDGEGHPRSPDRRRARAQRDPGCSRSAVSTPTPRASCC